MVEATEAKEKKWGSHYHVRERERERDEKEAIEKMSKRWKEG